MESASAEKSLPSFSSVMPLMSWITVVEFLMYDFTKGSRLFILKSSQVENTAKRLFVLLTTGLSLHGILCTLGSP